MRLLIVTLSNINTGMGHFYRALTLARTAYSLGHQVTFSCDQLPQTQYRGFLTTTLTYDPDKPLLVTGKVNSYDWVILDSPSELPPPITVEGIKLCLIDGVGHQKGQADLVISQGLEGEYCAPEYLILRPELFETTTIGHLSPDAPWLVWGGAADRLGLLPAFAQSCPDFPAYLLQSEFMRDRVIETGKRQWVVPVKGDELIHWMRQTSRSCCAFGMHTWEALALGHSVYAFSLTDRHLKSALEFAERGWIRTWPQKSLPDAELMRDFLAEPFEPVKVEGLDGQGCNRILKLLEEKI